MILVRSVNFFQIKYREETHKASGFIMFKYNKYAGLRKLLFKNNSLPLLVSE